jgi:ribonuclease Z
MPTKSAKLIVLGSASAVPDGEHDNTHLLLAGEQDLILIDCPNNPYLRVQQAGYDPMEISDLILTHFHPDHVSGAPTLLMNMWLMKRQKPLRIHGLGVTLDLLEKMMALFNWEKWADMFPVELNRLPEEKMYPVWQSVQFEIHSSPVCHLIPTLGFRFTNRLSGKWVAYSCDSEPCESVVDLARGAALLIHEAVGEARGHSSPRQAGETARKAGAEALALIHYPPKNGNLLQWEKEAQGEFDGKVMLARDLMEFYF